ncbi:aldolase [Paraburkholderia panacisoli]|uniref:Aldolase n=1 Tax=Paraburkholderia panacisoli TaxID=2603818 RepID=A0A5B0G9E9_9BURK|nr:aldolase/citrate lyase family protein [Paraburkholderia panacisoli]KAA0999138.1 aldolase [Paraburkholderia panacisoli]
MFNPSTLRKRLVDGKPLLGTFVKTPSHAIVEVIARSNLDFAVIDAEHAPFDRAQIDMCVLAARACGLDVLIRTSGSSAPEIQNVLDLGATGVIIPKVNESRTAREARRAASYVGGGRGYSNSPRAGGYGCYDMNAHIERADREATIICQIEDAEAVNGVDALAALAEVDGFLIGRADLAVSLGLDSVEAHVVNEAVNHVAAACKVAGKPVGIFAADREEAARYLEQGMDFIVVGSDQSAVLRHFRNLVSSLAN